jgi:hypothetical protein
MYLNIQYLRFDLPVTINSGASVRRAIEQVLREYDFMELPSIHAFTHATGVASGNRYELGEAAPNNEEGIVIYAE